MDNAKGSSGSWKNSTACPDTCTSSNRCSTSTGDSPPAPEKAPPPPTQPLIPRVSPILSALIQDIHHDLRWIFQYFECLGKKVDSIDKRLVHIEGIVDPSRALKPHIAVDIHGDDEDEDEDEDA